MFRKLLTFNILVQLKKASMVYNKKHFTFLHPDSVHADYILYKNIVFSAQAEYSYFSVDKG